MASNAAAKELIVVAKKRMGKFYNAALLQQQQQQQQRQAQEQLGDGEGEADMDSAGFSLVQLVAEGRPAPPPETMEAYSKKDSGGVLSMMDHLIHDVEREMQVAEREEKSAQEEYTEAMSDSAEKRATDAQNLRDKQGAKADLEGDLEVKHAEKKSSTKELMATGAFIQSLHSDCDWMLQYFDVRKEARADEIDALDKAKAVLSGADYALVQFRSSRHVRSRRALLRPAA